MSSHKSRLFAKLFSWHRDDRDRDVEIKNLPPSSERSKFVYDLSPNKLKFKHLNKNTNKVKLTNNLPLFSLKSYYICVKSLINFHALVIFWNIFTVNSQVFLLLKCPMVRSRGQSSHQRSSLNCPKKSSLTTQSLKYDFEISR